VVINSHQLVVWWRTVTPSRLGCWQASTNVWDHSAVGSRYTTLQV